MLKKPELLDEWWVPPKIFNGQVAPRHLLASNGSMLIYSDGARKTKECTKEQFDNWIAKYGCERVEKFS